MSWPAQFGKTKWKPSTLEWSSSWVLRWRANIFCEDIAVHTPTLEPYEDDDGGGVNSIVDHAKDGHAVEKADQNIIVDGRSHRPKTTKGWKLCFNYERTRQPLGNLCWGDSRNRPPWKLLNMTSLTALQEYKITKRKTARFHSLLLVIIIPPKPNNFAPAGGPQQAHSS